MQSDKLQESMYMYM